MHDTLANNWRQRMAWRSATCALLLAVPVLIAAQIGFSSGLGSIPFGFESLASGPDEDSLQLGGSPTGGRDLTRLLAPGGGTSTATSSAAQAAGGAGGVAGVGISGDDGSPGAAGPDSVAIDPPQTGGPVTGGGSGPGETRDNFTPPAPDPASGPTPDDGSAPPPSVTPVPGVSVPDPGGVVGGVTEPLGEASGSLSIGAGGVER